MKIDAIVQARTGSTRLPEKVLMDIGGQPMVEFLLHRLDLSENLDDVILATTTLERDDPVAAIGQEVGVSVVRGSEDDVLGRFVDAAEQAGSNVIARVCADNPLVDPAVVDRTVDVVMEGKYDHVTTFEQNTYPYGVGCGTFTAETLFEVDATTEDPDDREHVEPPMLRRDDIRTHYLEAPPLLNRPEISVTVDFEFEYLKIKRIADALYADHGYEFTTEEVISYLDDVSLLVFANGDLGYRCLHHLIERNEDITGLVLHPPHEAKRRDDILGLVDLNRTDVISPDNLEDEGVKEWIRERSPDLILSFWSSFIFDEDIIDIPPRGIVNLHNSKLPHCRGSGANIWTILEDDPGGVTMHYIVPDVDKGPIIDQRDVPVQSWDTGRSLFYRLQDAMVRMFREEWPRVRVGPVKTNPQDGEGSFHYHGEAEKLREIDLDEEFTARELIDRLRAFSFSPYEGCHFVDDQGNKVFLNLALNRGITTQKGFGSKGE